MISVIMPVHNAAAFLQDAIDSVLDQTEKDFELIIVNDGSTDESENIILSYTDPRTRYIKQANAGVAAARNNALNIAQGDFIAWHDADDISLPSRLEELKNRFITSAIGVVHSDMLVIDEHNYPIGYWQYRNIGKARFLRSAIKMGTPFSIPSIMMRRELLNELLIDTTLRVGSDSDMMFRAASGWDFVHIPEPLYLYRKHTSNLSNQNNYKSLEVLHVQKLLKRHKLEELVPEIDYGIGNIEDHYAKASAIIALFLLRRSFIREANTWLDKARESAHSRDSKYFIHAINNLLTGNYDLAYELLESCSTRDHIIENYLGETAASRSDFKKAYKHFMRALELNPQYDEPAENLKELGRVQGLLLMDNASWTKLKHGISLWKS